MLCDHSGCNPLVGTVDRNVLPFAGKTFAFPASAGCASRRHTARDPNQTTGAEFLPRLLEQLIFSAPFLTPPGAASTVLPKQPFSQFSATCNPDDLGQTVGMVFSSHTAVGTITTAPSITGQAPFTKPLFAPPQVVTRSSDYLFFGGKSFRSLVAAFLRSAHVFSACVWAQRFGCDSPPNQLFRPRNRKRPGRVNRR